MDFFTNNWKEIAAVAAIGAGAAFLGKKVPVVGTVAGGLVLGSALYGAGYYIGTMRPAGGWPALKG